MRVLAGEDDPDLKSAGSDENIICIRNSVYFYADVTIANVLKLIQKLNEANECVDKSCDGHDAPRVYLYIHSGGGEVFAGFSAMDHVWNNRYPVVTIADGYVASAATFILLGGTERKALFTSRLLIHQLSAGMFGKFRELKDEMKNNGELMEAAKRIYFTQTKLSKEKIEKLIQKEVHLHADKALRYGFVDEIW